MILRGDCTEQRWCISHRADPAAARLADRHYNRQKIGSPQFAPTGSCTVFVTDCGRAFWITSAPLAEWVNATAAMRYAGSATGETAFSSRVTLIRCRLIAEAVAPGLSPGKTVSGRRRQPLKPTSIIWMSRPHRLTLTRPLSALENRPSSGGGKGIRTLDLQVMSLTSCQTAPSRTKYHTLPGHGRPKHSPPQAHRI